MAKKAHMDKNEGMKPARETNWHDRVTGASIGRMTGLLLVLLLLFQWASLASGSVAASSSPATSMVAT
jgi:hypothetical protein